MKHILSFFAIAAILFTSNSAVFAKAAPSISTSEPTAIPTKSAPEPTKSQQPSISTNDQITPTASPTPQIVVNIHDSVQYPERSANSKYLYLNTSTVSTTPQTRYESQPFAIIANDMYTFSTGMIPYNLLGPINTGGVRIDIVCWNTAGCTAPDGSAVPYETNLTTIAVRPSSLPSDKLGKYMTRVQTGIRFPQTNNSLIVRITAGYGTEVALDYVSLRNTVTGTNVVPNGDFENYQNVNMTRNYPRYFREATNRSFEFAARPGMAVMRGRYQPEFTNGQTNINTFMTPIRTIHEEDADQQWILYTGTVTKKRQVGNTSVRLVVKSTDGRTVYNEPLNTDGHRQELIARLDLSHELPDLPSAGQYYATITASNGVEIVVDTFGIYGAGGNTHMSNFMLADAVQIQTATRQPTNWGAGSNNMNFAYSEIVEVGMQSPGTPQNTE